MESLKTLFHDDFLIGTSLGGMLPEDYAADELAILETQFNAVTPEICMKPRPVQPEEGVFHFQQADALVAYAKARDMRVIGHTLIWHLNSPEWFFRDGEGTASRAIILQRMEAHIHALAGRYRGKTFGWDVVNEAFDSGPGYLRDSPWASLVGDDFHLYAFAFAHDADPEASLYYNEWGAEMPDKRWKALRLISELKSRGLRIDGVGIQGHWELDDVPFKEIDDAISEFHSAGVQVMITELDVDVVLPRFIDDLTSSQVEERVGDPYASGCPPEILARQAGQYAELFRVFRHHADALSRVSFWGLHDGRSWLNVWPYRRKNYPLLFDRDCRGKAAYQAVMSEARA